MDKNLLYKAWEGFSSGKWMEEINVRNFILANYIPYEGDESFLKEETTNTKKLWKKVTELLKKERKNEGALDIDTKTVSSIISHGAGYIDKDLELIVGLQTDSPLKRAIMPFGGIRVVETAVNEYGKELDKDVKEIFTKYRKTHNQGVYDAYTTEMRLARSSGIITGLPDAYGRGRIIGDYRRLTLYGLNFLIEEKEKELLSLEVDYMEESIIREREEISDQIKSLKELKELGNIYGFDLSYPANNAKEAVQWTYFAYLAAVKEQDGAAMSLGRVSTFLDIYIERDIKRNILTEEQAQELIDQLVIKLRMIRFLRTKDYNNLFGGDPTWTTEAIGGMAITGKTLVTKNSFRILNTLRTLGSAPEPNLTVLWSENLPENFKRYCAKISIETSSLQFENDDIMRPIYGDDYAIACCVSAMKIGKQMQFFGARCNLAKALLYAINSGKDEISGKQVGPKTPSLTGEYLDYNEVMESFGQVISWLSRLYINTLNVIHYMHDKYCYEKIQMAFHDMNVQRTMATGIAGLSVVADSLSAIKYARVKPVRDENGLIIDFKIEGNYPAFGNNDDRVDEMAKNIQEMFMNELKKHKTYRRSQHTMSILTITSNVLYGEKTGNTPDGRKKGEAFAPGANPMHKREKNGALAALSSVAKLDYKDSLDGISYTFSIAPEALGKTEEWRIDNLVGIIDGYMKEAGHHININVINKDILIDAMENPDEYPQLTIRVSGYAVNFTRLSRKHQMEVISRTLYDRLGTGDTKIYV